MHCTLDLPDRPVTLNIGVEQSLAVVEVLFNLSTVKPFIPYGKEGAN